MTAGIPLEKQPVETAGGELYVLTLEAGGNRVPAGVLLLDPVTNALHVRVRRDWETVAPEESDVLDALQDDLELKAAEMGFVVFSTLHTTDAVKTINRILDLGITVRTKCRVGTDITVSGDPESVYRMLVGYRAGAVLPGFHRSRNFPERPGDISHDASHREKDGP